MVETFLVLIGLQLLGEWLALETQTDVQALRLANPAFVGDDAQALTFGAMA